METEAWKLGKNKLLNLTWISGWRRNEKAIALVKQGCYTQGETVGMAVQEGRTRIGLLADDLCTAEWQAI